MADIRTNSLPTTASSTASDDFIAVDGATNGTRKLNAYSPSFGGNATVSGNLNIGGELQISSAYPAFKLTDTNSNSDFTILNDNGRLAVYDETNAAYRLTIGATGGVKIGTTPEDVGANNLTVQGTLAVSGGSVTLTGAAYPNFYSDGSSGGAFTIRKAGVSYGTLYGNETNTILDSAGSANLILQTGGATRGTFTSSGLTVNATTASTSTSTGALVVSGGVGVAKEVYVGKTCKVGTGSDNEGYTNVFTNKAENTAGPFDITLPSDCVGVVFLNSYQGGVGRSFREIPFICFGGTVTLGTSRTTVLTADPVTSVAAAASSKITISLYAANTNCYWGIYVNKS